MPSSTSSRSSLLLLSAITCSMMAFAFHMPVLPSGSPITSSSSSSSTFRLSPLAASHRRAQARLYHIIEENQRAIIQTLEPKEVLIMKGGEMSGKMDWKSFFQWIFATLLQFGSITAFLWAAQRGFTRLPDDYLTRFIPNLAKVIPMELLDKLPGDLDTKVKLWAVRFFFLFMSLRSRVFSVLDASRPTVASEARMKKEEKRPSWMPPAKVFPIIWISIAFLRTISSSLIYEFTGTLLSPALLAFFAHLSIGDTWNHITNVRRLKGCSVPGVFTVWCSVVTAVYLYHKTLPLAGKVLLPSAVWISIANVLVFSIWRLNGKEPWYPVKGQ